MRLAHLLEQLRKPCQWQADDVAVIALDARDELGGAALDSVGSCFIHGFAGRNIIRNFFVCHIAEEHTRGFHGGQRLRAREDGNGGGDVMRASTQEADHAVGVLRIARLAEQLIVSSNSGIGTDDNRTELVS